MTRQEAIAALIAAEKAMGVRGVGELVNKTPMTKAGYMRLIITDIEAEIDRRMADEAVFGWEPRTRADIAAEIKRENAKYMALAEKAPETAEEDWTYAI